MTLLSKYLPTCKHTRQVHEFKSDFPVSASLESQTASEESSGKDDQEYSDASSLPGTVNPNDSESESDYKTGIEDFSEESSEAGRTETPKATVNRVKNKAWKTSSYVQNLLYEDSRTGIAVVDLFVAVKSAKTSIDDLANLNNTVYEKLISLGHETRQIQTGYDNLVQTMASFFDRVKEDSKTWKSKSKDRCVPTVNNICQPEFPCLLSEELRAWKSNLEAVRTPTANDIHQPEVSCLLPEELRAWKSEPKARYAPTVKNIPKSEVSCPLSEESRAWRSEFEAVQTPTAKSIHQPEVSCLLPAESKAWKSETESVRTPTVNDIHQPEVSCLLPAESKAWKSETESVRTPTVNDIRKPEVSCLPSEELRAWKSEPKARYAPTVKNIPKSEVSCLLSEESRAWKSDPEAVRIPTIKNIHQPEVSCLLSKESKFQEKSWKSEFEAVSTPTVRSTRQLEVSTVTDTPTTEIGRFCSSCGFVRYLRENVTCPLCKGEIIVREKCSECIAIEQSERRRESKCDSCRLSVCQYCGLPEIKNKKLEFKCLETESNLPEEMERRKPTVSDEKVNESFEQVQKSPVEQPSPNSPSVTPIARSSGGSIPSQTSSKVVESFVQFLVSHVLRSQEGSKSTTETRESLLSSLLTSKSGTVVSHEDSKKTSEGTMSLSDSTVQLICEICGILGMIEPQGHSLEATSLESSKASNSEEIEGDQGDNPTQHPLTDLYNVQVHQLTTVSDTRTDREKGKNSIVTIYLPESLAIRHEDKKAEPLNDGHTEEEEKQTKSGETPQTEPPETEYYSDGEVFEEALSEPFTNQPSLSASRHVNCMGDLTKEVTKMSKSVSTLTATNEFVSSWIGKIAEDIKTKIRNLKSGSRQISVTDEKISEKGSKKFSTALEFTISADTPAGMFDVTIRQYKDSRRKLREGTFRDVVPTFVSSTDKFVPVEIKTLRDGVQYWSDESFIVSDSDYVNLGSCSEEEMEEFIEVYVQSRKKDVPTSRLVSKREQGHATEMNLLDGKPPFTEMVRCQPKSFVQEIIPKTEKPARKDGRQEPKEVKEEKMEAEVEVNAGSLLVPGKGSGGRRNDEDQDSPDIPSSPNSPNSSVILNRSSNDLVICIQIDVDDRDDAEDRSRANNQIYIDLKVGGQEGQKNPKGRECVYLISKGEVAQVAEDVEESENNVLTDEEFRSLEDTEREAEKGRITFNETPIIVDKETENWIKEEEDDETEELESYRSVESEDSATKVMARGKSVTFRDELAELLAEEVIKEVILEPESEVEPEAQPEAEPKAKTWARADTIIPIPKPDQVEVHYLQNKRFHVVKLDPRKPPITSSLTQTDDELDKALSLIQELETNIIKVKLSEAIKILPVLESELRKHLRDKMKGMTGGRRSASSEKSVDNFFSALEIWPREEVVENSQGSEERLQHLLKLLSDLEEAVKSNKYSNEQICEKSSSRIYNLLQALTNNIRGLEEDANVGSLSETVDIASQLDTAVREFEDIVKKEPTDYVKDFVEGKPEKVIKDDPVKDHLTDVRKRVFEMVEDDAIETEERIEMDFDRIDRLERENEESMKFVEAFLEKTLRRSAELSNLRNELKNLSSVLNDMYQELFKAKERKERSSTRPTSPPTKEVPVRDTVSSLLLALDKLKTRAREKNEACKEILGTIGSATSNKTLFLDRKSSKSSSRSKSSYTTKSAEGLASSVKEFKRIGQRSLYLAWSKPEGILSNSIVGYEILVNGKLNQKVRNPHRQQAVLYSVDLSHTAEVQLFGLIENGSKVLLAIVTYLDL